MAEQARGLAERRAAAEVFLIPARTVAHLPDAEIAGRLAGSIELSERREAVLRSARIAFGEKAASVTAALVAAAEVSPKQARATATAVVMEPERFGDLEGRGAGMLRVEDEARRTAGAELPRLAHAVEEYGAAIERERRVVIEEHAADAHRQGRAVTVSRELFEALRAPAAEREQRLRGSESLREEASRLRNAFERRLSPVEQTSAWQEREGALARSLQISPSEAKALSAVHRRLAEIASGPVREQRQEREVGRTLQRTA